MDFAVIVERRVNIKEIEKSNKYLELARELKKLWNRKVLVILIVVGAREKDPWGFGTKTRERRGKTKKK